ncbi:MAG: hypothetical protein WEB06_06000 [Actinomycetota bacterium]
MSDTTCAVFARDVTLDRERIHRFVVGEDAAPTPMTTAEAAQELGDRFATDVLLQGVFPVTAEATVDAIKAAVPDGDPLRDQMTFILGEGSQIPFSQAPALGRSLRFVVTLGATSNGPPEGPDILISVPHPESTGIELMAWDLEAKGFNYYRSMGDPPAWVFAGNSRHALVDPTQGKGPFESHKSGALLMKELKRPWLHWDSSDVHIEATAFAAGDDRRTHAWFTGKQIGGAYAFEFEVAKPAMQRWAKARFEALLANGGAIERPARIMEQLLDTPAVNLITSRRESASASASPEPLALPGTFFIDADGLAIVQLEGPPQFTVRAEVYARSLETFDVKLADGPGFVQDGDTHFAFAVPERAFEDLVVLQKALEIGLVSRRLAACLLMTDFPNPIFSDRRPALLARVPPTAQVTDGGSSFSEEMANAILAEAPDAGAGSPEQEFAELWNVGEDFEDQFNALLRDYYEAVNARLASQAGFDDYFRLAESRRQRVKQTPIFESPLLFANTNIPPVSLSMQRDGTVV